jgi:hypothetical protein
MANKMSISGTTAAHRSFALPADRPSPTVRSCARTAHSPSPTLRSRTMRSRSSASRRSARITWWRKRASQASQARRRTCAGLSKTSMRRPQTLLRVLRLRLQLTSTTTRGASPLARKEKVVQTRRHPVHLDIDNIALPSQLVILYPSLRSFLSRFPLVYYLPSSKYTSASAPRLCSPSRWRPNHRSHVLCLALSCLSTFWSRAVLYTPLELPIHIPGSLNRAI